MKRRLVVVALALSLVAGCGGQPPVDPATNLLYAATAMAKLRTLSANLKFTKAPITFQTFTLAGAKTSVRMPTDSDTIYTVKQQDFTISLEVVISSGHVYLHVPFSTFQELTGSEAAAVPDMAKFFDPTTGLPAIIPAGRNAKYVSTDKVDGVDSYRIDAAYTADQVHGMLAQLSSSVDVNAQIWVGVSDHLIRKAILDGAFGDGGKQASVEVDISGFNAAVNISPPSP
ncbi:MAG: LppX_LprAFG lipoprotein [Candidatus Dormibacteraeota bacterium]|nr:LppX_LprAFG lipoprotein [Candidatus Dormibacteraeota bacterium]